MVGQGAEADGAVATMHDHQLEIGFLLGWNLLSLYQLFVYRSGTRRHIIQPKQAHKLPLTKAPFIQNFGFVGYRAAQLKMRTLREDGDRLNHDPESSWGCGNRLG